MTAVVSQDLLLWLDVLNHQGQTAVGGRRVRTPQLIQQQINDIEKNLSTLSVAGASGIPGSMEKVDNERVQTAKERLIAFREKKVDEKS